MAGCYPVQPQERQPILSQKDWEFGQKKTPSRWLTLTAWRVMQQMAGG